MTRKSVLALISMAIVASVGCGKALSVLAPSDHSNSSNDVVASVRNNWSRYLVIHDTGEVKEGYRDILTRLVQAGSLKGVRVGIDQTNINGLTNGVINTLGLDALGVIDNLFLFEPNIEDRIDQIFRNHPTIRYFQVGNEITTILPKSGPTMTIEEYMKVFKRVYDHVQRNHPNRAMLLVQPAIGSGTSGAREIDRMIELGLKEMSPDKIIISFNCYTVSASNGYRDVLDGSLRDYRVWVTETGVADYNEHISFVVNDYARLANNLRPERIYWYALFVGDGEYGWETGFGLVRNLKDFPRLDYWRSPLVKVLIGEN